MRILHNVHLPPTLPFRKPKPNTKPLHWAPLPCRPSTFLSNQGRHNLAPHSHHLIFILHVALSYWSIQNLPTPPLSLLLSSFDYHSISRLLKSLPTRSLDRPRGENPPRVSACFKRANARRGFRFDEKGKKKK